MGTRRQPRKHETVFQRNYRTLPLWRVKYCPTRNNVGYRLYQGLGLDTRKSFQGSHLNRRCPAVQWINSRRVKNCMLCVICISRGGSASVSFSEVEERAVDLRNVSTVPSQSEPTRYVRARTSSELPEASSILMTYSREAYTELELVTKVMSVTTVARFLDWMLHYLLRFMAQVKRSNRHLCAS